MIEPLAHILIRDLTTQGSEGAIALITDVFERKRQGMESYGKPLTTDTQVDGLKESLAESIDQCKYLLLAIAQAPTDTLRAELRFLYFQEMVTAIALKSIQLRAADEARSVADRA